MSKQYKRSFKMYPAWNYREEIQALNQASEQGWQLVRGGCFHNKFEKNPDLRYRYQLDYRRIENMGRYIETFREQGWEYLNSTFNGWHYFRKLYDPAQPEEAYEIFTDQQSLREMNNRWGRLAAIIAILYGIAALVMAIQMIRTPTLPRLILLLTLALESGVLFWGVWSIKHPAAGGNRRDGSTFLAVFLAVIILGAGTYVALTSMRPNMITMQQAASVDEPVVDNRWNSFVVTYADNYYLDLEMHAEKPMTFSILREDGSVVYTKTSTSFSQEDIRLRLPKGIYWPSMSCETGFELRTEIH